MRNDDGHEHLVLSRCHASTLDGRLLGAPPRIHATFGFLQLQVVEEVWVPSLRTLGVVQISPLI
jgi:hypothetical protein